MSSPRYRPNQQLEIYNFRVVPGRQIIKEVDFKDQYACLSEIKTLHCFVTNEAPFRFPEVILVPFEPQKRDLQLWNWPRASAKQGGCLFSELPF